MARPLRIEFAGALYHITSRGDGRDAIFSEDGNRERWLDGLGQVCKRFNWVIHAYYQMGNHYHLLAETPDSNLSAGMRQLNGVYTQGFNRIHHRVRHLFQGRYKKMPIFWSYSATSLAGDRLDTGRVCQAQAGGADSVSAICRRGYRSAFPLEGTQESDLPGL